MNKETNYNVIAEVVEYDEETMAIIIPREIAQSTNIGSEYLTLSIDKEAVSIHGVEESAALFISNEIVRINRAAKEIVSLFNNGDWNPAYTLEAVARLMAIDRNELKPVLIPLHSICEHYLRDMIPHDGDLLPFYLNAYIQDEEQRHALRLPE